MKNKATFMKFSLLAAILNLFDGIATNYGFKYNIIDELNPIMKFFMNINPSLFLCIKIALSILVIVTSYLVFKKCTAQFQTVFIFSLVGVCGLYVGILCMHIFWLTLL